MIVPRGFLVHGPHLRHHAIEAVVRAGMFDAECCIARIIQINSVLTSDLLLEPGAELSVFKALLG